MRLSISKKYFNLPKHFNNSVHYSALGKVMYSTTSDLHTLIC